MLNRVIKFRGKRIDNGEWVYGDLLQPTELCYIYEISDCESIDGTRYEVDPETIGQYTGLHDKNGKEIYEGDIILTQPLKDKPFSQKAKSKRLRGIVKYQVLCGKNFISEPDKLRYWGAEWDIEIIDKKDYEKYHNYGWGLFFECEVIGNIYDNPELLGGE